MVHIIDGKALSAQICAELALRVQTLKDRHHTPPHLAVIIVGDNPASHVYVTSKEKKALEIGMKSTIHRLDADTSQLALDELIMSLNDDADVHGILVQFPLPAHLNQESVINLIDPSKDVDGFHPMNVGYLHNGQISQALLPCTPSGCMKLIKSYQQDLTGCHAVIIGRSHIVGRPVAELLLQENCTISLVHSKTQNLPELCRQADILVAAVGKAHFVKQDWVKSGAIIIDVGINRLDPPQEGRKSQLVGDVDYDALQHKVAAITPVPGGVGPMTIACLLENTLRAYENIMRL